MLFHYALLAAVVGSRRQNVLPHLKPLFLHGQLGVAEHVLLFGELRLRIENLLAEVRIVKRQDYIPFLHHRALFDPSAVDNARFESRHLDSDARLDSPVKADAVVEDSARDLGDGDTVGIGLIGIVANPCYRVYRRRYDRGAGYRHRGFLQKPVFRFYLLIHYFISFSPL